MGTFDAAGEALIRVGVELQSGNTMDFRIDEPTFRSLERLVEEGLQGRQLCDAWLGPAVPLDRPLAIHVVGRRSDGSAVDLLIRCDDRSPTNLSSIVGRRTG